MAAGRTTKTVGDGNAGTITGGFLSSDGTNTGTLTPAPTPYDSAGAELFGLVTASPAANTVLGRLKDLLTGTILAAGSAIIGKVGIDQSTPGTTNAVALTSGGFSIQSSFTRPNNTTAYTAGDVVGFTATGALDLGILGPSTGVIQINSVQLEADITAIPSGQTSWVLYLYNVTPPSALADNAAWDLPSGDRASFLGSIAIPTMADLGSTLYVEVNNIGKQVKLAGTHLFGYLVTVGAFTPAAVQEVYKVSVHTVAL